MFSVEKIHSEIAKISFGSLKVVIGVLQMDMELWK
jgi:hypothetical protein